MVTLRELNNYFQGNRSEILSALDAIIAVVGPDGYHCKKYNTTLTAREFEARSKNLVEAVTPAFRKLHDVFQQQTRHLAPAGREFLSVQWERDQWAMLVTIKEPAEINALPHSPITLIDPQLDT